MVFMPPDVDNNPESQRRGFVIACMFLNILGAFAGLVMGLLGISTWPVGFIFLFGALGFAAAIAAYEKSDTRWEIATSACLVIVITSLIYQFT